jgi:hypothetical protein
MGQQTSTNTIKGRVGTISYYKGRDGYMARDKRGVDGKRIKNDPRYERTRENAAEFGRAVKASKEIRLALNTLLKNTSDSRAINRLSRLFFQILKTDPVSTRGMRTVPLGDVTLMDGFQFNGIKELKTSLDPRFYTPSINRETGEASIIFTPFIPKLDLDSHRAASHFRIVSAAVAVDFENASHSKIISSTASLPIDLNPTAAITLTHALPANSTLPLILVFGFVFEDVVNEIGYPLNDASYNPLGIVAVDHVLA